MTENKLTLEVLAPYLPYDLRMVDTLGTEQGLYCSTIDHALRFWKPILRPMSDFPNFRNETNAGMYEVTFNTKQLDVDADLDINTQDLPGDYLNMRDVYETMQVMFKYHFDVFGLIEKNLAISIHDIDKK